jgi:LssY C-terminus
VTDAPDSTIRPPRSLRRRVALLVACLLVIWLVVAYIFMPGLWKHYVRRHPSLGDLPGVTKTADGTTGDPLNVALVGTESQLKNIMQAARWFPAAALGLKSDLKIAADSVLSRPDDEAPVSNLYLFGRKEDLAFEQPVGDNPRHRHHVRFWKTDKLDGDGRPIWIGSAVYDKRVGLSRTTGQITHVTSADVDVERDYLFQCLEATGELSEHFTVDDFHQVLEGRNGGGDPWHTDGKLYEGVIAESVP